MADRMEVADASATWLTWQGHAGTPDGAARASATEASFVRTRSIPYPRDPVPNRYGSREDAGGDDVDTRRCV